jgi:hypothetical protein
MYINTAESTSTTLENSLALFDKLCIDKLKAVERCYALERMNILPVNWK